jgi:hypothetical protein
VRGGGRVDEPATLRGQRDQDAPAVAGIGLAGHVTGRFEPVESFGRAGRGQHQGRGEVGRAQPVGRPGAPQGGQDVVPARLETAGGVAGLKPPLDLPGQAGDPPDHADGGSVEVRTLAVPLLEDRVDAIGIGHEPHCSALGPHVVSEDETSCDFTS